MTVASPTRPGRSLYMYRLMNSASGIVMAIVNTPHGLSASALTKTRPTPASAMTMMKRMATAAVKPATGPISMRAISASDLPFRRVEAQRIDHVVHGAGQADAGHEPDEPGQETELGGEHGPDERSRAGDRREMMAEQHPLVRRHEVVAVLLRVRRRDARVVERHHLGGQERAVVAIGDRDDAERRNQDIRGTHGRHSIL